MKNEGKGLLSPQQRTFATIYVHANRETEKNSLTFGIIHFAEMLLYILLKEALEIYWEKWHNKH